MNALLKYRIAKIGSWQMMYNFPWQRKRNTLGQFYFGINNSTKSFGIHFLLNEDEYNTYSEEKWGISKIWYDGNRYSFGLGKLARLCWYWG